MLIDLDGKDDFPKVRFNLALSLTSSLLQVPFYWEVGVVNWKELPKCRGAAPGASGGTVWSDTAGGWGVPGAGAGEGGKVTTEAG